MNKMLIFGYKSTMNYNCIECNDFCCKTEYEMPIFNFEQELIVESYPNVVPLIKMNKESENFQLIRSNSCSFLGANSGCIIHRDLGYSAKPLVCQIYPLIFKKYEEFILIYKYPCKGMKWYVESIELGEENEVSQLSSKIDNLYQKIFSDQVDGYDPFMYISSPRILQTELSLKSLEDNNLILLPNDISLNSKNLNKLFQSILRFILPKFKAILPDHYYNNSTWMKYKINLITWLHYNPFILAMNLESAWVIISLAIVWGEDILRIQSNSTLNGPNKKNLKKFQNNDLEKICWSIIEIVNFDWWENLLNHYIPNVLPKGWETIEPEIKKLLEKDLLPFPD